MSTKSPWSVKGIAAQERELAKQAARRAGVPIGQWLSEQIRMAANGDAPAKIVPVQGAAPTAGQEGAQSADQNKAEGGRRDGAAPDGGSSPGEHGDRPARRYGFGGFASGTPRPVDSGPGGHAAPAAPALPAGPAHAVPSYPGSMPPAAAGFQGGADGYPGGHEAVGAPAYDPARQQGPRIDHRADHRVDHRSDHRADPRGGWRGGHRTVEPAAPAIDPGRIRDLERKVARLQELEKTVDEIRGLDRRLNGLSGRIDGIVDRLVRVENRDPAPAPASAQPARTVLPDDYPDRLPTRLRELEEGLAEIQARPTAAPDGEVAPVTAPIERAVMRLSDRILRVEEMVLQDDRPRGGWLGRLFRRR